MKLLVFDLDTALCRANAMDGLAFASAIKDVAGCHIEPESFQSIHDIKSLWYQATQRVATVSELNELTERYSVHFRRQFLIRPRAVNADQRLVEHLNYLQENPNIVIGLMSAASQSVLLLKARAAGLRCETLPMATGDDADSLASMLNVLRTRVSRSFGYHCTEADLIGSHHWQDAAERLQMQLRSPEEYALTYQAEKPKRESLFSKSRGLFSLT